MTMTLTRTRRRWHRGTVGARASRCFRPTLLQLTGDMADCLSQAYMHLSHWMLVLMNDLFQMDDDTTFLGFSSIRCVPDESGGGGGRVEALVLFTVRPFCDLNRALANMRDKLTSCSIAMPTDEDYHSACKRPAVEPSSLLLLVCQDWGRKWRGQVLSWNKK